MTSSKRGRDVEQMHPLHLASYLPVRVRQQERAELRVIAIVGARIVFCDV